MQAKGALCDMGVEAGRGFAAHVVYKKRGSHCFARENCLEPGKRFCYFWRDKSKVKRLNIIWLQ
jgi:hypothetical protein